MQHAEDEGDPGGPRERLEERDLDQVARRRAEHGGRGADALAHAHEGTAQAVAREPEHGPASARAPMAIETLRWDGDTSGTRGSASR